MGTPIVSEGTGRPSFAVRLTEAARRTGSLVCVGLDPDLARLPVGMVQERDVATTIVAFNEAIIGATVDLVCAYKPNLGFYLAHGEAGLAALAATRRLIPPETPVILDAKIADIGSTAVGYAQGVFDVWGFDAVTVNPYLGGEALDPFLDRADRGVFVLCKTSNPGSGEFQDLALGETGEPLHLAVAGRVAEWAKRAAASLGLVVGATYPAELAAVRRRCPDLPILLPGVGAQAGDLAAAVAAGLDATGGGLVVTSSRAILYASSGADFAEQARAATVRLRDEANAAR